MPSHPRRGPAPLEFLAIVLTFASSGLVAAQEGKVPITTKSEEARQLYLKGRDLQERLRGTDAHEQFRKAAAADKDFALAQLGLANTAPSAKEFFDALKQATPSSRRRRPGSATSSWPRTPACAETRPARSPTSTS